MAEDQMIKERLSEEEKEMIGLIDKVNNIEMKLGTLTNDGIKTTQEMFNVTEQKDLREYRGQLMSVTVQANAIIDRVKKIASKLKGAASTIWQHFNQLTTKIATLLAQYMTQLGFDSVSVSVGTSLTITVTLKALPVLSAAPAAPSQSPQTPPDKKV
jgi:small nuclear ribonucleoprotein (snRNP)-like protein